MAVELRTVDAAGNVSEILPDWANLTFSQDLLAAGTLTFDYPTYGGRNANLLTHGVRLAIEMDGYEPLNSRFTYFEGTGSRIAETDGGFATYSCGSHLKRFDQMKLTPQFGSTNITPDMDPYVFKNRTPGYIVMYSIDRTMARATTRSANPTPWLTYPLTGFSATVDSAGIAWPQSYDVTFENGVSLNDILQWTIDNGLAEPAMDKKIFKLWNPANRGRDLTTGPNPVVLQTGRDFTTASYQTSSLELINCLLVVGDDNKCVWLYDQPSIDTYGYREGVFTVSGGVQASTLTEAGTNYLNLKKDPRTAYTYAVNALYMEATSPLRRPFVDYEVGDKILIFDGNSAAVQRIRLLSATWPNARSAAVNLSVNDWFAERAEQFDRRIKRLETGLGG